MGSIRLPRGKRQKTTALKVTADNVAQLREEALANLNNAAGRLGQDRAIRQLRAVAKFLKEQGNLPEPTQGREAAALADQGVEGTTPTKDRIRKPARVGGRSGMSVTQVTYVEGKKYQTQIFRRLKSEVPGFSSLPVQERIRLNLRALGKVDSELIPGIISQMGTHYFTNDKLRNSDAGRAAIDMIQGELGDKVKAKVDSILSGGVEERRAMGAGNKYDEQGRVTTRTGSTRKEVVTGKVNVPAPKGGYKTKRTRKGMDAGRKLRESATPALPSSKEPEPLTGAELRDMAAQEPDRKKRMALEQAAIAAETNTQVKESTKTAIVPDQAARRSGKPDATMRVRTGGQREQSAGLALLSRKGAQQNRQVLVDLATKIITEYRSKYGMPPSGWAPVLREADPLFGGMSDSEARRIAREARTNIQSQGVAARAGKKPAAPSRGRVELSPSGADVTGKTPKRRVRKVKVVSTRSGQQEQVTYEPAGKNQAAVDKAEADFARDRQRGTDKRRADRKTAVIKGDVQPDRKPATNINTGTEGTRKRLADVVSAPEGNIPARTRRATKTPISRAPARARSLRDETLLNAIAAAHKAGGKSAGRAIAENLKVPQRVRKRAQSAGLMGVAATFGTNYILSLLEESKKGKK